MKRLAWLAWDALGKLLCVPAMVGLLPLSLYWGVEDAAREWAGRKRRAGRGREREHQGAGR